MTLLLPNVILNEVKNLFTLGTQAKSTAVLRAKRSFAGSIRLEVPTWGT